MGFQRAEKKQSKLRAVLTGPSGSGKTHSALLIASGIGSKIAVIDTENARAALKAKEPGIPAFDISILKPPYTVQKYIAEIDAAVKGGYDVLVIDSLTHAWKGEGGLLDQKHALDQRTDVRNKNHYANWGPITQDHERFKAWLLNCNIHLIATMRSKQDYMVDEATKKVTKLGMAPEQRDGMEYEFSFAFDLDMRHTATVSKTDATSFDGRAFVPTREIGEELLAWLNDGVVGEAPTTPPVQGPGPVVRNGRNAVMNEPTITQEQWQQILESAEKAGIDKTGISSKLTLMGYARGSELPQSKFRELLSWTQGQLV